MTLTECRRLEPGDFTFSENVIWRVADPPLIRRRVGYRVVIEAASGTDRAPIEVPPAALRRFGKLRRASAANQLLAERLRSLVQGQGRRRS